MDMDVDMARVAMRSGLKARLLTPPYARPATSEALFGSWRNSSLWATILLYIICSHAVKPKDPRIRHGIPCPIPIMATRCTASIPPVSVMKGSSSGLP